MDEVLRRLARQEALCRRVIGRLARPFLRRRAHVRLGFIRIDDYARERLGVSGRELQELGRVSRRLEELPHVSRAFAEGALSWSHVRLLASIATPDDEAEWVARARTLSVRALAAPRDPDDEAIDGEPSVRFRLRCPRRVRRLWHHANEYASRMSGTRLAAWRAAEVIAAEGSASAAVLDVRPAVRPCAASPPDDVPWEAIAEALPDDVARLAFMADALDPFQLDARLAAAVRALQRIDFQTGRLLRLVADRRLHHAYGFRTLADYVRDRLGCSQRRARALLALDRRLVAFPALTEAYRSGEIGLARALAILPVLHPESEAEWVRRAQEVTLRRLSDFVEWAVEVGALRPPSPDATPVLPPLEERQMCARACDAEVVFDGPASVVSLFRAAVRAFTPRGAPVWEGLERLLLHALGEWTRQPRHRDPIFERDGWRCAVPACTARASLHDHHVVYRSEGGTHAWGNRVAICAAHHIHGIHGMRIKVSGVAPHDLTWEIGLRRPRPPLFRTHGDRYLDVDPRPPSVAA